MDDRVQIQHEQTEALFHVDPPPMVDVHTGAILRRRHYDGKAA